MKLDQYLYPLGIAFSFLTRLPVNGFFSAPYNEKYVGLSILYYPLVGFCLALLLCLPVYFFLAGHPPLLVSSLIVTLWVLLTGALHLDGLADSIDAVYAGHGQVDSDRRREKIFTVLKDPTAGPMAIVGLVLYLLLKVIFLSYLITDMLLVLVLALTLSRTMALAFVISTPSARSQGIGHMLSKHVPNNRGWGVVAAILLLTFIILSFHWFAMIALSCACFVWAWRVYWMQKIQGLVGDCIGALIELGELLILILLYFLMS